MFLTEKEAREKYCINHPHYLCEGSNCIAWVWIKGKIKGYCRLIEKEKRETRAQPERGLQVMHFEGKDRHSPG